MLIVCFGECMLELSGGVSAPARLGFGGDTFNTAVYLARLGLTPSYLTAVGCDPYSEAMLAFWRSEGLATELALRCPDRLPGLYAVHVSTAGERRFYYWRRDSAARALFAAPGCDAALRTAGTADLLYLSGITLSLYTREERARLCDLAASVRRRGGEVAFDPNYRPAGWPTAEEARAALREFAPHVSVALPTLEDEQALWGGDAAAAVARWRGSGAREIVVKQGPLGALAATPEFEGQVPVPAPITALDTTAAGDAFNAAYLASRLRRQPALEAVRLGHTLAGIVIQHPGAITPASATASLRERVLR